MSEDQAQWTAEEHLEEACKVLGWVTGGSADREAAARLAHAQMEMARLKAERFGWSVRPDGRQLEPAVPPPTESRPPVEPEVVLQDWSPMQDRSQ